MKRTRNFKTAGQQQADRLSGGLSWASAHRGRWGQLTPLEKMDEKLKSENMQKRAVY